jgi:hypothetical protein
MEFKINKPREKIVKYNPAFPIEEIKRANGALERASAIAWRRETHTTDVWREKVDITLLEWDSDPFNQLDGDVYTVLSNGKTEYPFLLEIKHQLSFEPKGDWYEIVVSENWLDRGKDYPRLGYIVGLPLEDCLYYCHSLKSKINSMIAKGTKLSGGGVRIKVHKSLFQKIDKTWSRKDVATWEFRTRNGAMVYGKKQNYFEPEQVVVEPIDNLIMAKKIAIGENEKELAELFELKRLANKYGVEIIG